MRYTSNPDSICGLILTDTPPHVAVSSGINVKVTYALPILQI